MEEGVTNCLKDELAVLYPDRSTETEMTHAWSGMECWTTDEKPIVGAIPDLPGQYISAGYNGMGMVKAYESGKHVAELIAGVEPSNPLISVEFSPDRFDSSMAVSSFLLIGVLLVSLFS